MADTSASSILAIVERHLDAICASMYTDSSCSSERHCILAWLAIEAGIELPPQSMNAEVIGMPGTERFAVELQRAYGLTLQTLKFLQFANDDARDPQQLLSLVKEVLSGNSTGREETTAHPVTARREMVVSARA